VTNTTGESEIWEQARAACSDTAARLSAADIAPEALAEYVPESRRLKFFTRSATMRPLGEVWRLGALLLGTHGTLYALGQATRAAERGRVGYQSLSRESRRDLAAAALAGGYAAGTTVNFNAVALLLDGSVQLDDDPPPIGILDGEIRVRWRSGASLNGAQTLRSYLRERADLLIHPPLS